ncbi:beta strand repeat-containing protein [Duganella sp. LjRoot269]|jgi:S-layer protein|uniref:beta strand repeat-containing protein n=1 Tax=Duganella sp. LjRoot269 TaxID=3342305 RepID=UPI003ECFA453
MAATDYAAVVQQLYISYFGRPADTYGLQSFEAQLAAADTDGTLVTTDALNAYVQANPTSAVAKLVSSFNTAPESVALYGSGTDILSISKFVNAIYNNVLHRDADTDGGTFWINEIVAGRLSKANAALAITQGALANTSAQGVIDAALVTKTAAAAADFTTSLDTIPKINSYAGDAAAAAARDLLKQVDSTTDLTAFHATIVSSITALIPHPVVNTQLTAGVDVLTGSTGDDVFFGANTASATTTTWSGLDKIDGGAGNNTLTLTDTNGGIDLSLGTVTNIQTLNVQSTGALASNAADVSGFTGLTAATFLLKSAAVQTITAGDATAVTVSNTAGATVVGGASINVTSTGSTAAAATSTAAAAQAAATAALQTAVAAAADATAVGVLTTAAVTAGTLTAAQKTTIDTAAGTSVAAAATATGTIATADATTAATAAATLLTFNVGATSNSALASATIKGGNTVTLSDGGNSTLKSVTLDGNAGAATLTGKLLTSVSVANTAQSVTINNSTTAHAETITLNKVTGGTITDAAAKTLTVTSTGSSSSGVTISAAAATAVTLAGDKALSATLTAGLATAVTLTGAGGFTGTFAGVDAAAVITATASTGANKVTVGAGQSYLGGSGVDTVTIAAAPTAAISGGAGTADVLVANIAADFSASGNTKISGFETLGLGTLADAHLYDATGFTHLQVANAIAGAATFNNVAAGTDLAFSAAAGQVVTYALASTVGTTDVLNVSLKGSTTAAATNSLAAAGIETVNITTNDSNSTAGHTAFAGQLTLADSAVTTIKVTGTMGLTLVDTADVAITSVDASGVSAGGFIWTTGALTATSAAVTIKGSAAGGDTINAAAVIGKGVTITEVAGTNTITGSSTIASTLTGGTGADTIHGGAGKDTIVGGGGADVINGGVGADLITVSGNTAKIVQANGDSGVNTSTTIQTAELTSTFDVIKGLVAGDKIDLGNANIITGTTTLAGTNLAAGADNTAVFSAGTYDAANGVFTYGAAGTDTALTYDADSTGGTHFETIILVGYHATTAATTVATGVFTL